MRVNGRQLAVESAGAGPAVVFLHGIGGTSNVYQVQAEALAPDHQVIRPDFAGAAPRCRVRRGPPRSRR